MHYPGGTGDAAQPERWNSSPCDRLHIVSHVTGAGWVQILASGTAIAGPFHGPYRRRARLDAVRIVVSSATRNAGSYTCVSTGSAGCREITPPLAGPTPGPVNPGPPAGTLRTSLHILTTPTAKVRPA